MVGFGAIKKQCEEHMAAMRGKVFGADAAKYNFYRTTAIVCDAAILLSKRYAEECRRQAEAKAADDPRKAELLKMADSLDWIMENPARNTWEALQVVLLYHMMLITDAHPARPDLGPGGPVRRLVCPRRRWSRASSPKRTCKIWLTPSS